MGLGGLTHASLFTWFGLIVAALPVAGAVAHAVRPTEQRLAALRPLSLAALFATLANLLLSLANSFHAVGPALQGQPRFPHWSVLFAEACLPAFVGFTLLTAAWLIMAVTARRAA